MSTLPPSFPPQNPPPRPTPPEQAPAEPVQEPDSTEAEPQGGQGLIARLRTRNSAVTDSRLNSGESSELAPVSDALHDRLQERRRAKRRLRIRALVIATSAVAVLALAVWVVLASPWLALRSDAIEVVGADDLVTADEVRAAVLPFAETPLLRLNVTEVAAAVEGLTPVREAQVERAWPNGVLVTVVERVPVAVVAGDGVFHVLDADAVRLFDVDGQPEDLPVIDVDLDSEDAAAMIDAVLTALQALPEDVLAQVRTAGATTVHDVQFRLNTGAVVLWGSADESELKASVLVALLPVAADVYDVSAPRSPVTR